MEAEKFFLSSMTSFSRSQVNFEYGRFVVEMQSLNRRHLEITLSLPRMFSRFEMEIRKKISERVGRGMITYTLFWRDEAKQPITVMPNLPLAKGLKNGWEKIAFELGLEEKVGLHLLRGERDLFVFDAELQDDSIYRTAIYKATDKALEGLILMKRQEGEQLASDFYNRIELLGELIKRIEQFAPDAAERMYSKLKARLKDLFPNLENEEKIQREIALFTEKVDITEEIVRFKAHLEQFSSLLKKPLENEKETRGKLLDFLLQEMNREVTTLSNKSVDLQIAQTVVLLKNELEKIREQVQNIE